jgi:hypothetical protein
LCLHAVGRLAAGVQCPTGDRCQSGHQVRIVVERLDPEEAEAEALSLLAGAYIDVIGNVERSVMWISSR